MPGIAANRERDWLVPCVIMTIALGLVANGLSSAADHSSREFFVMFPLWATYCVLAELIWLAVQLLRLKRAGVASPMAYFRDEFDWSKPALIGFGALLSGTNMICFMWIKSEINLIAPFQADEWIANAGHAIFGKDPWRFFDGMDLMPMALTYNILWFWALMIALFVLLFAKPSPQRSAALISYFFLWSLFGPIGQYLVPAAGPIFYERIGLGPRYNGLYANLPPITGDIAGYLWNHYTTRSLGFGSGISAMPSLHIATATWMVISLWAVKSRLAVPALILSIYLYAASIALGWHYALDGVAGALGAVLGNYLGLHYVRLHAGQWQAKLRLARTNEASPAT